MSSDSLLGDETIIQKNIFTLKIRVVVIFEWREGAVFGIGHLKEVLG